MINHLKPGAHIHLMGICGTAMASLAGILKDMGYYITGSDENVYPPMSTQLHQLGIEIMSPYRKENLIPAPDFVVVGNVIRKDMEEAQYLLDSEIPYTSLPRAMGEFVIGSRDSIVVAGTHGKTTITSMMSWIMECCNMKPGFLIGGIPLNFNKSFRAPQKDLFVIEGDEYDTAFFDKVPKFIYYKPKYTILTSIEFDHIDIYKDLEDVKKAFYQLMEKQNEQGVLVINGDDRTVKEVAQKSKSKVISYGFSPDVDYRAVERESLNGRNHFSVELKGKKIADIAIKFFGQHNTLNALGAFALSKEMGFEDYQILQALSSFKGVKRRQELIGEINSCPVIEDFAHHPTAVRLTIECMKEAYPHKKIIAVFEPRSATARRNVFQSEYIEAFENADLIYISEPFKANLLSEEERFSVQKLVDELSQKGQRAKVFKNVEEVVPELKEICHQDYCLLIMSNGSFQNIYKKLFQ